jgi:hypothetical protein
MRLNDAEAQKDDATDDRFAPTAVILCTFLPSRKGRRASVHE